MRRYLVLAVALLLVGFTPAQPDGKGDWSTGGSCTVDSSGWEISFDKSKSKLELSFWIIGDCEYPE